MADGPRPAPASSPGPLAVKSAAPRASRQPARRTAPSVGRSALPAGVAGLREFGAWAEARHQPLVEPHASRVPSAPGLPAVDRLSPAAVQRLASAGDSVSSLASAQLGELAPGVDPEQVRIHTGDAAADMAAALGAEAFTIGRDIFFAERRFDPASPRGRALLAHELVHVRQQTGLGGAVMGYGDGAAGEAEAEAAEQAVLSGGRLAGESLAVGTYVRNYASADGRPLSAADRARLDALAMRALVVCREILGPDLARAGGSLGRVQVDLSLDLASQTDDEAARVWGEALADRIRAALAGDSEATWIRSLAAQSTTLQRRPAEVDPAALQRNVDILRQVLARCNNRPNALEARLMVEEYIEKQPPAMANAILEEIQKWNIRGKTGREIVDLIFGPIDEEPDVARQLRERLYAKGITAFELTALPAPDEALAGVGRPAGEVSSDLLAKLRSWKQTRARHEATPSKRSWIALMESLEEDITPHLSQLGFSSFEQMIAALDSFVGRFREEARLTAIRMLDANEVLVFEEARRYGAAPTEPGSDAARLVAVGKELWTVKQELNRLEEERRAAEQRVMAWSRRTQATDYGSLGQQYLAEALEVGQRVDRKRQELSTLTDLYALRYPALKAADLDLEALAAASPRQVERVLAGPFASVLENIAATRANVLDGSLAPLSLPPVVEETKALLGVAPGSPLELWADDAVREAKSSETLKKVGLAALAIGLGVLAAIPTGGSSLAAAAAGVATVGGAGLSAYGVAESVAEFRAKTAARGAALDPARAISREDPSLFWLAVDVVAGIADAALAYKALKEVGLAFREVQAGRRTIQQAQGTVEEIAAAADEAGLLKGSKDGWVRRMLASMQKKLAGGDAGADASTVRFANWGEKSIAEVTSLLEKNVDNPSFMKLFYKEIDGWEHVKHLAGRIPDGLFQRIHQARDKWVDVLWNQVADEFAIRVFNERGIKIKFGSPYVGTPPWAKEYKRGFSDLDLCAFIQEGGDKLTWAERARLEMEAMEAMNRRLADLVGDSGRYLDVNVYVKPRDLPSDIARAEGRRVAEARAGREVVEEQLRALEEFAFLMDAYEIRMGLGQTEAGRQAWAALKSGTKAKFKGQPDLARKVERYLVEAERRFDDYERQVADLMRAKGIAEGAARLELRAAKEKELLDLLARHRDLFDDPARWGTKAYEEVATQYERLQMEMRSRWNEAYVGRPGAELGSRSKAEAARLAESMSQAELARARVSQAAFMLDWLKGKGAAGAAEDVVQAWKAGKYEMRELTYMEYAWGWLPEGQNGWLDFLKQVKGVATPEKAWGMWVRRFKGDEAAARAALEKYLRDLGARTERWLQGYFATHMPGGPRSL